MGIKHNPLFIKDVAAIEESFPKLRQSEFKGIPCIEGEIDICDVAGSFLKNFNILIIIPSSYPHGVPILIERSNIIRRIDSRHISKEGVCCTNIDHELLIQARRGLQIIDFIRNSVYPYLANQIYYNETGHYASDEYPHGFDGVIRYYENKLNLTNVNAIMKILNNIVNNTLPNRNDPCLCNSSKKFKQCHENAINQLKQIGVNRLRQDLLEFEKLQESQGKTDND